METVIKKIGENTITKQMAAESIKDIAIGFADATVGLLDWEGLIKAAAGIAEETVLKLSGPTGWGIDTIFKTSKYGCYVMQATEISINLDSIPVCVHTPHPAESFSINGVSVDGTGSVPEGAMLQVFRVYDADALVWFDDKEDTLANNDYELYNICLVKGDETVSSDGIVSVKIRIPEGHSENLRLSAGQLRRVLSPASPITDRHFSTRRATPPVPRSPRSSCVSFRTFWKNNFQSASLFHGGLLTEPSF